MSSAVTPCCSSEFLRTEECIQSKDIKYIVLSAVKVIIVIIYIQIFPRVHKVLLHLSVQN